MVRFSDIIPADEDKKRAASRAKKGDKAKKSGMEISKNLKIKNVDGLAGSFEAYKDDDTLKKYFEDLLNKANEVRDRVVEDKGISPSPVLSLLHNIIEEDLIDNLYQYVISAPIERDIPSHSVCVTLASLKVGKEMGYDTKRLLRLGLAAFMENVGMYKIPDGILEKDKKLSQNEIAEIRKHPEKSAQIIETLGRDFQWLADVALQIHERSDGSGYPQGIKEKEISEFASIIGIVDSYVAMITNRPYRNKHLQSEAVKSIIALGKGMFPTDVVKGFLNQISLFPLNTYVRLNNNSVGRVVSTDKRQPLRPTIEILYDGRGEKIATQKIVSLSDSPLLHIIETIDENEIG
jgi:HD-GYP domain-containing protein (c-di-GMP phosphodiesterase class II)